MRVLGLAPCIFFMYHVDTPECCYIQIGQSAKCLKIGGWIFVGKKKSKYLIYEAKIPKQSCMFKNQDSLENILKT